MGAQIEPGQKASLFGFALLVICGMFLAFYALYSLPEKVELADIGGRVTDIEIHDGRYPPDVRWFEIRSEGETLDLCISDIWEALRRPAIGDSISIKGYIPYLGPCDYQAMELSHNGEVLVSYSTFKRSKSLELEFFSRYFIGPVSVLGVVLVIVGMWRNKEWKRRGAGF